MEQHIGPTLRLWRKRRGLSQEELAGLAGITQPYLSQIETCQKTCARRSTLTALAAALSVSVGDLLRQPGDPTSPARIAATASVPAIRTAVVCRRAQGPRPDTLADTRPIGSVAEALEAIQRSDYAALGPMLPDLLLRTDDGPDLVKTGYAAMYHLRHLGYEDLAREVATLTLHAAREHDDPTWLGIAHYVNAAALPAETPQLACQLAATAAEQIQSATANPETRQAYGMLHLTAALRAATMRQSATALTHLAEAQTEADSLGEPDGHGLCGLMFGPTNVNLWRIVILHELGQHDTAISVAESMQPQHIPQIQRRAAYWRDYATALTTAGLDDLAVAAFNNAELLGPQPFRLLPTVRESVEVLAQRARRRALTPALSRLTDIFTHRP